MTHRAQIGWVFRLIVLAATRSEYGCCRLQSCEVSPIKHRPKKLLDHGRDAIRLKHDLSRAQESPVPRIKRSILFHNKRHPNEIASADIEAFLTPLALAQQVAASTQRTPHECSNHLSTLMYPGSWISAFLHDHGNTFPRGCEVLAKPLGGRRCS